MDVPAVPAPGEDKRRLVVSHADVEAFLKNTTLVFQPSQAKVSFQIIERIHRRLQNGNQFEPIKIVNGVIVDGHHRYICQCILDMHSETVEGGTNHFAANPIQWGDLIVEPEDYDSSDQRKKFEEQYDKEV